MNRRYLMSWLLIASAAAVLVLAVVGSKKMVPIDPANLKPQVPGASAQPPSAGAPAPPTEEPLVAPALAGQLGVFAACLLATGYLVGAHERIRRKIARGELPERDDADKEAERMLDRTLWSLAGGLVTAGVFLLFYSTIDFNPATELSERRLDEICPAVGWPVRNVPRSAVVQTSPGVMQLLPEFLFTGAVIGMILGHVLPPWRRAWRAVVARGRATSVLDSVWFSYPAFGLVAGSTLGAVFNVFIFSKSDGRPFLSIQTAVAAASLSVVLYLVLEIQRHWHRWKLEIVYDLSAIVAGAFAVATMTYMADQGFHLSEQAYCQFYSAWDTRYNLMRTNGPVLLVAAAYGAFVGAVVMLVVSGFRYVRVVHEARRLAEQD